MTQLDIQWYHYVTEVKLQNMLYYGIIMYILKIYRDTHTYYMAEILPSAEVTSPIGISWA